LNVNDSFEEKPDFWSFSAPNEEATDALGAALARVLAPGLVVALIGDLGAGKTRLVQGVAAALGVDRLSVTSPTFVLHQEYPGSLPIHHFDTYRLRDSDEFLELGAAELLDSPAVSFVEWGDRVSDTLPADHLRIEIEATGPCSRTFRFRGFGPRSNAVLLGLRLLFS
jgi:tRNA threonylcarbamoyladenosine biosynthesis protein TsaE